MVTTPPDVVRTRASSTVLVKASSLVNRDFAGMLTGYRCKVVEIVGYCYDELYVLPACSAIERESQGKTAGFATESRSGYGRSSCLERGTKFTRTANAIGVASGQRRE